MDKTRKKDAFMQNGRGEQRDNSEFGMRNSELENEIQNEELRIQNSELRIVVTLLWMRFLIFS